MATKSDIRVVNIRFGMVLSSKGGALAKIIFGEMAQELLLSSTKVKPDKLLKSGYSFMI